MAHETNQACIDACDSCAEACDHCATACLQEADVKSLAECIRLDLDCAAICRLASGAMARGSSSAVTVLCAACAEVCDRCAQECDKHGHMAHCRDCAEACRACAAECRRMAGSGATKRSAAVA